MNFITLFKFYNRSIGGKDPSFESWPFGLVVKLEELNPKIEGIWQNITICTLFRSCSEITSYKRPNNHCKECSLVYNHCPWVAEPQNIRETKHQLSGSTHVYKSIIYQWSALSFSISLCLLLSYVMMHI
jgi:hypothetical protein